MIILSNDAVQKEVDGVGARKSEHQTLPMSCKQNQKILKMQLFRYLIRPSGIFEQKNK